MKVWLLSGNSESGDDYPWIAAWDYKPSEEEITRELIKTHEVMSAEEYGWDEGPASFPNGEFSVEIDGVKYVSNMHWDLTECSVITKDDK